MGEVRHKFKSTGGNQFVIGRLERAPALVLLLAFASGIAVDVSFVLESGVILPAALGLLLGGCLTRQLALHAGCLLGGWFCLGAALHDQAEFDRAPSGVSRIVQDDAILIRFRGRLVAAPVIETVEASFWSQDRYQKRTRCLLAATAFGTESGGWIPVDGRVQLTVSGALPKARLGDDLETIGWLRRAGPPRNPGGFDLRAWDIRRDIDARLYTDYAAAVTVWSNHQSSLAGLAARARRELGRRLDALLSPENAAVARAMLLGDRTAISDELRDAYRVTGAMHVLAISGMHIIILAAFLIVLARIFTVSPVVRTIGVLLIVWAYAILTGLAPPVTRAALFLSIWAFGVCLHRGTTSLNTVAIAALALLICDPLVLFDLGARLSFLAVLGINWASRIAPNWAGWRVGGEDAYRPLLYRWGVSLIRSLLFLELMGVGIWLFTGPLIAREFGLLAPIGLPLNLVLVPLSTIVLWLGFVLLAVCALAPVAAVPWAAAFDGGLRLMNALVEWAAMVPGGHSLALAPPGWWLAVWYVLLLLSLFWLKRTSHRARPLIPLLAWGIVALAIPSAQPERQGLRLTVLEVGHGGAIVIEAPSGQTLLYDCGSLRGDRRAARSVWDCLQVRGHRDLDALFLSHADLDHCNNVPALLRTGPVREIFVSRTFLDFEQRTIADVCAAAGRREIPIRLLQAGDEMDLGSGLKLSVLHPPDRRPMADDNANSLVLRLEYAGRNLLLTGDVEGMGQMEMFAASPPRRYDVILAPHHGSLGSNTAALAAWVRPRFVLVSCGDRVNRGGLESVYSRARDIYCTSRRGAITVTISPNGVMAIETQID